MPRSEIFPVFGNIFTENTLDSREGGFKPPPPPPAEVLLPNE